MDIQKLKREIFEEILEKLHEEAASMNACATAKADETAGKAVNEEAEAKPAEEAKAEEKPAEEIKDAGTVEAAAEVKEQTAAEPAKEEEVIKIETLNSSPIPTLNSRRPAWKDMKPDEFIRWIDSGAYKTAELD